MSSSKKTAEEVRMHKSGESRAESQPSKQTHVLQKQDSSKYLRGENTNTANSNQSKTASQPENPELKIPKKYIKEKSNNSSVTRGAIKNSAVIYKVSFLPFIRALRASHL